jgi:hypothetical protein
MRGHAAEQIRPSATRSELVLFVLCLQEVAMLKGLNYDCNITQFYGACIQPGARPMLISEFMEGVNSTVLDLPEP